MWLGTCFSYSGKKGKDMAASIRSSGRKLWQTLSSIKTGVILLILVVGGLSAALGYFLKR